MGTRLQPSLEKHYDTVREAQRSPGKAVVEALPSRAPSGPTTQVGRDARTGEFIPMRDAICRPSTTTVETIPKRT